MTTAGAKISEMTLATTLDGSELFEVVQDGATRAATAAQVISYAVTSGGYAITVSSLGALKALTTIPEVVITQYRETAGDHGGGEWVFRTGDQSARVTTDPMEGVWTAPDSDPTGASGAWFRQWDGINATICWWGGETRAANATADNKTAFEGATTYLAYYGGGVLEYPPGDWPHTPSAATNDSSSEIWIRGAGSFATRLSTVTAAQTHLLSLTGYFHVTDLELSGWTANGDTASWATYGLIGVSGQLDVEAIRAYRFVTGISAERGNFRITDSQCGFISNTGLAIGVGIDAAANPIVSASWLANVLTITTTNDPRMLVGRFFTIYGADNASINGVYTCSTVNRTTKTVTAALVGDPGAITGDLGTYSQAQSAPSSISEVRVTRCAFYSGAAGASIVDVAAISWSSGTLTVTTPEAHTFEEGDAIRLRFNTTSGVDIDGNYTALAGTMVDQIVVALVGDPGTLITPGEVLQRFASGAAGITLGTGCGATIIENTETGSFDYGIRSYDDLGLGVGTGYRGCGFLTLRGFTSGVCGVAGVAIETNGASFTATSKTKFSAPGDSGIGLLLDSPIASADLQGVGFHRCSVSGIKVIDAFSVTMDGGTFREIGLLSANGTAAIDLFSGTAKVALSGTRIDQKMQSNTAIILDNGILVRAAFSGSLETVSVLISNTTEGINNQSSTATVISYDVASSIVVANATDTAAQVMAYLDDNDQVWVFRPFTTEWTETFDLTGMSGKKLVSFVAEDTVMFETTASPGIQYNGDSMTFEGAWCWEYTGASTDSIGLQIDPSADSSRWGICQPSGFAIGRQITLGPVRGMFTQKFKPIDITAYGQRFYSTDITQEVGYIVDDYVDYQPGISDDTSILTSIGPAVGSGGIVGYVCKGGVTYGARHALHAWNYMRAASMSWSGGVATYTFLEPHGLPIGALATMAECSPSGYNVTQGAALAGTTGMVLKLAVAVDPGASVTPGIFCDNIENGGMSLRCPRSIHFYDFTRRSGSSHSFLLDGGADIVFSKCKSDDPGYTFTSTSGSWAGGTLTLNFSEDTGARVGDETALAGYTMVGTPIDGAWTCASGTTGAVIKITMADPGAVSVHGTSHVAAHGLWNRGAQGKIAVYDGQMHEHGGNGIRHENPYCHSLHVENLMIYNSSTALTNTWSGYKQSEACRNVTLINVASGPADIWRTATNTVTFSTANPTNGQTVTVNGVVGTFATSATLGSHIQIGALYTDTADNFTRWVNDYQVTNIDVISATVVHGATSIVTLYADAGTAGNAYTLTESASNVSAGAGTFSGGFGTTRQKYGFEGIVDGRLGCVMRGCDSHGNTSSAFSRLQPRLLFDGNYTTTLTSSASNAITVPASGTLALLATSNAFTVPQTIDISDATLPALRVTQRGAGPVLLVEDSTTPDATPLVVQANGDIVAGTLTTYDFSGSVGARLQMHGTTGSLTTFGAANWHSTTSIAAGYRFGRSISNAIGTHTLVTAGTLLGTLGWDGSDGAAFFASSTITGECDITATTGIVPGRLKLRTASAAGTMTTALTVDSSQQTLFAAKITVPAINGAADAQGSDTYVITLSPVPAAYTTFMPVYFTANTANTTGATLNVNGLGAKNIVKALNTTLATNDILAGMMCHVVYDGTNFVLMNPRVL